MLKNKVLVFLSAILAFSACVSRHSGQVQEEPHHFPVTGIPSVYATPEERQTYLMEHYWDSFFSTGGTTDSSMVLGVPKAEVEQSMVNFIGGLDRLPMAEAQKCMGGLFEKLEKVQLADTSAFHYLRMTEMVSKYLYDPNSPLRNEDYYLPFVRAMAASPCTAENMRQAYQYEAQSCSICQYGTIAPDFTVMTISGATFTLHSVKAENTMLFFSNPGCHACKDIINQVMSNPAAAKALSDGSLAVVNVYIDEDLKAWREYEHNYPKLWKTGYDFRHVVREERLYDARAIPSLYLLDSGKRILMKDAPVEKVLAYIANKQQKQ